MVGRIRIGGVVIPENKPIWVALSYIRGIGKKRRAKSMSNVIFQGTKVDPLILAKSLDDEQIKLINQEINKLVDAGKLHIEDNLEQKIKRNIQEKIDIGNRQGNLHSMGKKVNGQSTRHNNRNRPSFSSYSKWPFCITKKRETVANKKKAPKQG